MVKKRALKIKRVWIKILRYFCLFNKLLFFKLLFSFFLLLIRVSLHLCNLFYFFIRLLVIFIHWNVISEEAQYITSAKGFPMLLFKQYTYVRHSASRICTRWTCSQRQSKGCKASISTDLFNRVIKLKGSHSHPSPPYVKKMELYQSEYQYS